MTFKMATKLDQIELHGGQKLKRCEVPLMISQITRLAPRIPKRQLVFEFDIWFSSYGAFKVKGKKSDCTGGQKSKCSDCLDYYALRSPIHVIIGSLSKIIGF